MKATVPLHCGLVEKQGAEWSRLEKRLKNLGVVLVGISQTAAAGRDGGKNRDKQGGNKMNSALV